MTKEACAMPMREEGNGLNRRDFLGIINTAPLLALSGGLPSKDAAPRIYLPGVRRGGYRGSGALYAVWREAYREGGVHWGRDAMSLFLVDPAGYSPDLDYDRTFDIVPRSAWIAAAPLTGMRVVHPVGARSACDAEDVTIGLPGTAARAMEVVLLLLRDRDGLLAGYLGHRMIHEGVGTLRYQWAPPPQCIYQL